MRRSRLQLLGNRRQSVTVGSRVMRRTVAIFALGVLAASCSEPGDVGGANKAAKPTSASAPTGSSETPSAEEAVIDGMFDVGGHSLYLKCQGTEPPTIVYMHGSITESSVDPHANGASFLTSLGDEHRVCVYDRRNLAHSDTVDATQLPEDAIGDMHELLAAAHVEPPYVLLGASFGGILSYLYANTYPDDVVGMVLLDAMFPDELSLEYLFKPADRYKAFDAEDDNESLERISHFKAIKASQPYIGREPAIPVTYLSSIPEGYNVNDFGIPEYDRKILRIQKAYVERFEPGRYLRVDAPHFMEVAIREKITKELRRVIAEAGY